MDLENISAILASAIQDETTFAEAEALYAELFKDSKTFTLADGFYSREELVNHLMTPIYEKFNWREVDDWFEPSIIKEGYSKEEAEALVDHIEFVELCNYKGEGEGFELACRVPRLRTFHAKHNYS